MQVGDRQALAGFGDTQPAEIRANCGSEDRFGPKRRGMSCGDLTPTIRLQQAGWRPFAHLLPRGGETCRAVHPARSRDPRDRRWTGATKIRWTARRRDRRRTGPDERRPGVAPADGLGRPGQPATAGYGSPPAYVVKTLVGVTIQNGCGRFDLTRTPFGQTSPASRLWTSGAGRITISPANAPSLFNYPRGIPSTYPIAHGRSSLRRGHSCTPEQEPSAPESH
jgi:hypothetical protein